jgi:cyclase
MIAVIDYNSGNVASVRFALEKLGQEFVVTRDPKVILSADKVIFPGQGRAGQAMKELRALGLVEILKQIQAPFLGICLGMQLLYEYSEEDETEGLGILKGAVRRFSASNFPLNRGSNSTQPPLKIRGGEGGVMSDRGNGALKVPLIGWNIVTQRRYNEFLQEVPDTMYAYFVNSYFAPADDENVLAFYTYGSTRAAAIVKKGNFYGTQFHPEKSGRLGIQILKNFYESLGNAPVLGAASWATLTPYRLRAAAFPRFGEKGSDDSPCEIRNSRKTLIIPAIDLMDGKCVRLRQGRFEEKTEYAQDPVAVAKSFVEDGAQYLHVIDLDGAKAGEPKNTDIIMSIVKSVSVPVQTGGGMRSEENVKKYLEAGVARVILGTSALAKPEMVQCLVAEYGPGRIVVSVDGKDGKVAVNGWQETTEVGVTEFIQKLQTLGVTTIIYTDVKRDGELQGPNFEEIQKVLQFPLKVIIAGGVTTIEQTQKLQDMGAYGVIVGKALYEGQFNLAAAIKNISQPTVFRSSPKPASQPTKRIIACMDIADGRVKKGTNFVELRDAGDPVELGKLYSDKGIDELMFLDITATVENRATIYQLVERVAREVNIPFAVGGGVKTIEDIRELLNRGADKVSIGSAAVKNPEFVKEAAEMFGSQCIVVSVDPVRVKSPVATADSQASRNSNGVDPKRRQDDTSALVRDTGSRDDPRNSASAWEIYIKGGREATGIDAVDFAKQMAALGAGELLVNSIDRDGTRAGYDLELLIAISNAVNIPVIASSGAGKLEHFAEAFAAGADAALAASLFHFRELEIKDLKMFLLDKGIPIRV